MNTVMLSTAYFPPIEWCAACLRAADIRLEAREHFIKQTYRNRASIYGANGKLDLIVPVEHADLYNRPIQEIRIASDHAWKKIHWRSIESAYRNSPFFEYYETGFKKIFDHPEPFLFQWNLNLMQAIFDALRLDTAPSSTILYEEKLSGDILDYRNRFHPRQNNGTIYPPYSQVFSSKLGFIPGLSIIDLLFNQGNESGTYLQKLNNSA